MLQGKEMNPTQDICANRHGGNALSASANRVTDKKRDMVRILNHLLFVDDATCDELEVALNLSHQTCSARMADLKRAGHIFPTVKRKTRTGSLAQAWAKR